MNKMPKIAAALVAAFGLTGAQAQALEEIKVSYQPALYWSLPFYVATEKNWWAEVGLKPAFSTFPAGVPQIAAAAAELGRGRRWVPVHGGELGALHHQDHRHHQRRVARQCAPGSRRQGRGLHGRSRVHQGPDDRADRELHRRLRGAVVSCEMGPQEGRRDREEHGPGRDHLGHVVKTTPSSWRLGAQHVHARGEGRCQDVVRPGKGGGAIVQATSSAHGKYLASTIRRMWLSSSRSTSAQGGALAHRKEAIEMMKKFYEQGGVSASREAAAEQGIQISSRIQPGRAVGERPCPAGASSSDMDTRGSRRSAAS